MKLISSFCTWYMNRLSKKAQTIKKQIQDKKLEQAGEQIKALYEFVKWMNEKGFRNRHERKAFWKNVAEGKSLVEETLLNMLKQYGVKEESIEEIKNAKYRLQKEAEAKARQETHPDSVNDSPCQCEEHKDK